jgi:hypothetical protein
MSDRHSKELDIDIVDSYTTVEWFGISQFEQNQVTFGCASVSYLEDDIPVHSVWYHWSQLSHARASWPHMTAFEHMSHGY